MATALEALIEKINGMPSAARSELQRQLDEAGVLDQFEVWRPQKGPQTEGYFSTADLTLYGGAAGGGKTDLIAGLSLFAHHKVAIFRQSLKSLKGLTERMNAIMRKAGMGKIAGNPPRWVGPDERAIEFGHLGLPGAEEDWQGRDHDLKAFDEGAQMDPRKIIFVLGWLRSTRPGQRCRGLIATNPPLGGQGDFLVEWFAPWLDPLHPLFGTVKPGELLWAAFIDDGDAIRTVWVDGPEPVEIEGEVRTPKSRTFIPALRKDNQYLGADYDAQLDQMPEPMRTALKTGDFMAARQDHEWQVIPSEWVELAFQRYDDGVDAGAPMDVLAADVAQGGKDKTVLQPLHGRRFETAIIRKGVDTKDGADVGSLIIKERRDGALIVVDCTGGWGGDTVGFLSRENNIPAEKCVFSAQSGESAKDSRIPFYNLRAQMYWRLREALHPKSGLGLAIRRSATVKAQLTAHRWKMRGGRILIESKEEIKDRTGSSPDEADAVVIALEWKDKAALKKVRAAQSTLQSVPLADPLGDF
ncbi:terminase [Labrenzia sp. PO1]|uniref:terminase n=1 Tax=Labrenzia sp. PO1 TaxID=2720390 RepID=UPI0014475EFC|nr:terminase [Labrenzia sp. PO1]NKI61781.1 terminase [Labrenzia sp. PO1]